MKQWQNQSNVFRAVPEKHGTQGRHYDTYTVAGVKLSEIVIEILNFPL